LLPVFFRVVERRSFRAVARELGVTQPTISRQIADLEAHLAVKLLHRTTRQVSPTEAGMVLYERGSQALRMLSETEDDLRAGQAAMRGVVRIAAPGALGRRLIAPRLRDLQEKHPGLSFELLLNDRNLQFLQGTVHFAIRIGPQTEGSLVVRQVGLSSQCFVVAQSYAQRRGKPGSRGELAAHALVARNEQGPIRGIFAEAERQGARLVFASDDIEALFDAVRGGLGVGLLPRWLVQDDLHSGALLPCVGDAPPLEAPVSLVRPGSEVFPRRARVVFDAIATSLAVMLR
jgi:DNA-binding transcriptional LysR family regulator